MTGLSLLLVTAFTACEGGAPVSPPEEGPVVPLQMEVSSGGGQVGHVDSVLAAPLVVRAQDSTGLPKSDQVVNFVVVSGGGSLFAGTGITNSDGIAQDYWTLGPEAGVQVLEARAVDPGTGERLVFATFEALALAEGLTLATDSVTFSMLGDTTRLQLADGGGAESTAVAEYLSWRSTASEVASVDGTGLVRSEGNGEALILVSGDELADTAVVRVDQLPDAVSLSPESVELSTGDTARIDAEVVDGNGFPVADASLTWSSAATSVATVSGSGLISAVGAGSTAVTATTEGVSGTAEVTVTDPTDPAGPPGTVSDLQVVGATDTSITLRWTQVDDGTGSPASYMLRHGSPTISWGTAYETEVVVEGDAVGESRTYTRAGLEPGTSYEFQTVAYRGTPDVDATFGELSNTASGQTTSGSSSSSELLSEGFEDGDLGSRGWFDTRTVAVADQARPGSSGSRSLEWRWAPGTTAPQGASRADFGPSGSVYLSYWVKFSGNWIGSGRAYHPHAIQMLTTADDRWTGPSITHLTVYDELLYLDGDLTAQLAIQDALMIDESNLEVDLRGITEQRSIGGYNGQHEFSDSISTVSWDLFQYSGGQYTNYKLIRPRGVTISDAEKDEWHHIESYRQLNSVVNGIGQQDGVLRYWVDGELRVDRSDVFYRTGANPDMKFSTFVLAPYIGDGSPVDQTMWIDDLVIATTRP